MSRKSILIGMLTLISMSVIGYYIIIGYAFHGWSNGEISKGEEIMKTNLGDEFLYQYVTRNFPDYETEVTIMDTDKKNKLVYFVIEGDFRKPTLVLQINSQDIRCYEVNNSIIYKVKNGKYKGISENLIGIESNSDLIIVAKALIAKKDWKWIKICGSFLLKDGDNQIKETLEKYALGQFTMEELNLNKDSELTKEQMQIFAKQTLEQR